jgi:dihydroflavonol-4-reductase
LKIPHSVALGYAYAENTISRILGREPQIPVEGVKIARHNMFVDCSKAARELGFAAGPVSAALERAVNWYETNGYLPRGVRRAVAAAA